MGCGEALPQMGAEAAMGIEGPAQGQNGLLQEDRRSRILDERQQIAGKGLVGGAGQVAAGRSAGPSLVQLAQLAVRRELSGDVPRQERRKGSRGVDEGKRRILHAVHKRVALGRRDCELHERATVHLQEAGRLVPYVQMRSQRKCPRENVSDDGALEEDGGGKHQAAL